MADDCPEERMSSSTCHEGIGHERNADGTEKVRVDEWFLADETRMLTDVGVEWTQTLHV